MEAKEFDSTANTGMSSEQSQVASPEAAVGEPPPATLNGAATTFAPAAAPGVVIAAADVSDTTLAPAPVPMPEGTEAAVATDEVTSTAAAASAPNKTKDEQGDKEEVPDAVASVAAAAGVATAGHSMDGERCDMELAPSTPQPAAGAEGVEMFTTPMQQLPVDSQDSLNNLGERLMDRMRQGEQQQAFDREQREQQQKIGREQRMLFLTRYADQQDKTPVDLLQLLDQRAGARWTQVNESLTVRIDTAQQEIETLAVRIDTVQQETSRRIEDLAEQASALSQRLDNDQTDRILKTKETNVEQESKVSRQLETVADGMDLRFHNVEKKAQAVSKSHAVLSGRVTNLEKASKLGTVLSENGEQHSSIEGTALLQCRLHTFPQHLLTILRFQE